MFVAWVPLIGGTGALHRAAVVQGPPDAGQGLKHQLDW